MKQDEKTIGRMNWLFYASFLLPFLGLGAVFVGLIARGSEPPKHWGIWFSIAGWGVVAGSIILRWWVKRWFRRLRE